MAAYVRDATFAPMDDESLASYVAPWLAGRFEKHRTGLGAAYRMLGSTGEADDAVQEAWLRLALILVMSRTWAGG